ncbi:MAG TPA: EamA family transporter [Chloroflexota bacterium]|nr:EamA family transporter [Chloroflexota bacterium]
MISTAIDRVTVRRGLLLILLAGALWGTSGVTTKTLYRLSETTPISVAALRLALGAPVLLALSWRAVGGRYLKVRRSDFGLMLFAGASMGISQACYFSAIPRAGVAAATLVAVCTAPVLVALLSAALLRERLTLVVGGALASALLGTVLLVDVGASQAGSQDYALGGILFALGAGLTSALLILTSRRLAGRCHPLQSIAIIVTVGALLLLAASSLTTGVVLSYPPAGWALLIYLGLVPTALAYGLFFHGMRGATATVASIGALAEPLTSTLLAMLIFGEQLGTLGLLGATLLIGTMLFLYRNDSAA